MAEQKMFPYKFNTIESAMFVEIYLPKKIRYQGVLYKSLRTGFDFKKVKDHLKNPDEFMMIGEFLEDYEVLNELYKSEDSLAIQKRVDDMEETFYGYSMYEVDGVFSIKRGLRNPRPKTKRKG